MTLDADFWTVFAIAVFAVIAVSIIAAAVWSYIFRDRE